MSDTGYWKHAGEIWHVIQSSIDGSIRARSDSGATTSCYSWTWDEWKKSHGWEKAEPSNTVSRVDKGDGE